MALGFDSACNRNEYQGISWGIKAAGAWSWQTYHLHVPIVEPQPPGTLRAFQGLYRDRCTFTFTFTLYFETVNFPAAVQATSSLPAGMNRDKVRGRDVNIVPVSLTKITTPSTTCIRMSGVFISVTSVSYSARKCRQDSVKNVAQLKYLSGCCAGHEGIQGEQAYSSTHS
jgi:hypothetical protein